MKKHLRQREQFCALLFCFVGFLTFYGRNCQPGEAAQPSTFCNPLNLPYRFSLESPSRREAADPTIVRWKNEYWLFASKSGGYWHSSDFAHWTFVVPSGLPIENYAPDVEVINGMYFTAVGTGMFTTSDPAQGQWMPVGSLQGDQDPALFVDSDGKVYFYYGSSATDPIKGVELDASSFAHIGNSPGWMLLSYKKAAAASSTLDGHPVQNAFDEDIRTGWSAASGNAGEWLSVDLGKTCQIRAIQINFADEGSTTLGFSNGAYRYVVEVSNDNRTWTNLFSRQSGPDAAHDYAELDQPVKARYVRLTNMLTPNGAKFSVSGLRIFGKGLGQEPAQVGGVVANVRRPDKRTALVSWNPVPNADFYVVRYGIDADRLYSNVQVYGQNFYPTFVFDQQFSQISNEEVDRGNVRCKRCAASAGASPRCRPF